MVINENNVIEWKSEPTRRDRILRTQKGVVWTIDIDDQKTAWPIPQKLDDLKLSIADGSAKILDSDPDAQLKTKSDADIPEKHRKQRDELWTVFASIIDQYNIFDKNQRAQFITEAATKLGRTKKNIIKYLRRWLQSGMACNALLPRYDNCGSPKRISPTGRRLGRYRESEKIEGIEKTGVSITPEDEANFKAAIRLFHKNKNGAEPKLKKTYDQMVVKFYSREREDLRTGRIMRMPYSIAERPTFRQFQYWYNKTLNPTRYIVAAHGQKAYQANYRPKLGSSVDIAPYPMAVYAIDSTELDINLISSIESDRVIGRAKLYVVMDMSEGLVTGLHITPETATYTEAALAIENAFSDKVEFCQKYGLTITSEEWPAYGICQVLLADRGKELLSNQGTELSKKLRFRIDTTASYRGDMKGRVEQFFNHIREGLIAKLPGYIPKRRIRGTPDPAVYARLTLRELTHLVILYILEYNKTHFMKDYPLSLGQLQDSIAPVPLDLWNWGIANNTGSPRVEDPKILKLLLYPTGTATVTQRGILFKDNRYSCDLASTSNNNWYVKARLQGTWNLEVVYHPHHRNVIYLRPDKTMGINEMTPCFLVSYNDAPMVDCSFYETDVHNQTIRLKASEYQQYQLESNARLEAAIQHTTQEAERRFEQGVDKHRSRSRPKGIDEAKLMEREHQRQENMPQEFDPMFVISKVHGSETPEEDDTKKLVPRDLSNKFRKAWDKKRGE